MNLLNSKQVNAFCMPGGKIAFFTGILQQLQLNDDEVAMIMGHEMAHALREHARERMGKTAATRGAIEIGAAIFGLGSGGRMVADMGGQLLTLRFGREDESEADLIGIDLSARAGYDPKAGVTLWQKMAVGQQGRAAAVPVDPPVGPHPHQGHPGGAAAGGAALRAGAEAPAPLRTAADGGVEVRLGASSRPPRGRARPRSWCACRRGPAETRTQLPSVNTRFVLPRRQVPRTYGFERRSSPKVLSSPWPGHEGHVVPHRPEPLRDRCDQLVEVTLREVGAADAAGEEHVAHERAA